MADSLTRVEVAKAAVQAAEQAIANETSGPDPAKMAGYNGSIEYQGNFYNGKQGWPITLTIHYNNGVPETAEYHNVKYKTTLQMKGERAENGTLYLWGTSGDFSMTLRTNRHNLSLTGTVQSDGSELKVELSPM